jgi:hypothetical protein
MERPVNLTGRKSQSARETETARAISNLRFQI